MRRRILALGVAFAVASGADAALAQRQASDDRHEGYYYPKVASREAWPSRAQVMQGTDRRRRIAFATGIAKQMSELPYPAPYSFFVKGDDADKLIIVANGEGSLNTPYRARALLAHAHRLRAADADLRRVRGRGSLHLPRPLQAARHQAGDGERRARLRAPDPHPLSRPGPAPGSTRWTSGP
jgi:hypothetical protein